MSKSPTPNQIISWVKAEAQARLDNAGYDGRYDDGGYGALLREVQAYQAGLAGTVPLSWEPIIQKHVRQQDAEYQEYLRLANKYGKLENTR
jgi:hypothetical protein